MTSSSAGGEGTYRRPMIMAALAAFAAVAVTGCSIGDVASPDGSTSVNSSGRPGPELLATSDNIPLPDWATVRLSDDEYSADRAPYIATVIGYGDPDSYSNSDNIAWIQLSWTRTWIDEDVDSDEVISEPASDVVVLDMVMPYEPATCGARDPDAARKAREALERLLPIGSTVLAVRGSSQALHEGRFLHVLASPNSAPDLAPPLGSVNEALVATGTWVPDANGYYYGDRPYDAPSVLIIGPKFRAPLPITSYDPDEPYFDDDDYGRAYSDRIIAAANTALASTPAGDQCRRAYTAYVKREVKKAKENDRETKEWLLQMERDRRNATCRDGDGDGICFER